MNKKMSSRKALTVLALTVACSAGIIYFVHHNQEVERKVGRITLRIVNSSYWSLACWHITNNLYIVRNIYATYLYSLFICEEDEGRSEERPRETVEKETQHR